MDQQVELGKAVDMPDWDADGDPVGDERIAAERSLVEDVRALIDDGRLLAEAELDFQKKRLAYGAQEAKGIVAALAVAAVLAFFALMAFVVGLVLALGQILTYWGSTALVTLVLLALAYLLVRRAQGKIESVKRVATEEES